MSSMAGAIILLLVLGGFVFVGSMWFFAKTYRMLFGATGYGATGDFVRSLPLTEKEVFAGKLLTGSLTAFGLFLLLTLSQICIARALSITIHWRTLAMNSPLILLMLVLLSLCATALYSIGMAMTYQRGEENHTVSMVTWAEVIVLLLPFLVLLLPLLVPAYHASVGAALKPLLLITLVLAVLTPLLVRGAYRTFDWGTAEYRGSHRGGPKAARTSILPQSKTPAQMYTWLLRQCGAGGVLQQCLWTLLLVVIFVVQELPAYLIPILIVGTGARLQAYRAADAACGKRVLRAFGSRPQSAADALRRSVHLLPAAELCAFDGGRAVQWSGDVQCGIRRLAAGCGGSQPEPAGWQRL